MTLGKVIKANINTAFIQITDFTVKNDAYLELSHPLGPLLAQVISLNRTAEGEIAEAKLLGHSDGRGGANPVKIPPDINESVTYAEPMLIRDVLGVQRKSQTGLYVGKLQDQNLKVYLDLEALISRHVAVIAKTGRGKSYLVGVLIEELLKRRIAVVVIDPHGEYTSIAYPNDNKAEQRRMRKFDVNPRGYYHLFSEFSPDTTVNLAATALRFDEKNLDYDDIVHLTTIGESDAQCAMLERTLYTLQSQKRESTIDNMMDIIGKEKTLAKYRLIRELKRLKSMPIFDNLQTTKLYEIVKPGRIAVINLRGVDEQIQAWCAGKISKRIFDRAKEGNFPPVFIIIEEAHRFIPEGIKTVASNALATATSEGRKFGVGLCIVSQRIAKVSKNVLSQAGTHMICTLTSSADLDAVASSLEGWTKEMNDTVQRLPIGVALISADSLPQPIIVEIRVRESRHGGARRALVTDGQGL